MIGIPFFYLEDLEKYGHVFNGCSSVKMLWHGELSYMR